jgi:hypothetical protein
VVVAVRHCGEGQDTQAETMSGEERFDKIVYNSWEGCIE